MLKNCPAFCITSIALPRLVSEYFAARAQSDALISAKTAGDVANTASNNPL